MTTKKSCTKPANAMVKLGDSDWTPCCESDVERARAKSAKAGQVKGVDKLQVNVRALSEVERANKPKCLISSLGV